MSQYLFSSSAFSNIIDHIRHKPRYVQQIYENDFLQLVKTTTFLPVVGSYTTSTWMYHMTAGRTIESAF